MVLNKVRGLRFFCFIVLMYGQCFSQKHGLLSFSFDPKMAIEGPYETSEHGELDMTIRLACFSDNHEIGLYSEIFSAIEYYSFGVFYNYKILLDSNNDSYTHWVIPIGGELGFIKRNHVNDILKFNFGLNGSLRYFFHKNIALELGVNVRYRSDLEKIYNDNFQMRYNGFTGLVFVWP